jgi:hypothetical protein
VDLEGIQEMADTRLSQLAWMRDELKLQLNDDASKGELDRQVSLQTSFGLSHQTRFTIPTITEILNLRKVRLHI